MSDLARLFSDLLGAAMQLDIPALRSEINDSRDDGLRAASYDSAGGRSADVSSHPERLALNPRRDRTDADLSRLESLVGSYIQSIGLIAVRSRSGAPAQTWDGAVKDHNLLDQMDAVGVLERTGQRPARLVHQCGDALHDLEVLARRHETRREPTEDEKHWHDGTNVNDVCAWHLEIHERHRRPRFPGLNICDDCRVLAEILGQKPPRWLREAMIDHGDRPIAWRASLSRAMDELGVVREAG